MYRYDEMMKLCQTLPRFGCSVGPWWPLVALPLFVMLTGCNPTAAPVVSTKSSAGDTVNVLDNVREELKRPFVEPEQIRFALEQLSSAREKITVLDSAVIESLKSKLRFTDADIKEITRTEFGPLDAHVVYQALLFSDAARSLNVRGASLVDQTAAALGWVNRHVRLEQRDAPPDPPALVIQRGTGTALERIYVLAALCQALEFETFIIGDEDAAGNPQRVWGVGIVQSDEVFVLDPRFGIALPGTKGIATLAELEKNPDAIRSLIDAGYDVTTERLKKAKLFPAMPLAALAPRMKVVENLAPKSTRISSDARRLVELVAKLPVVGWDAKTQGTPVRTLSEFLPVDEGGSNRPLPGQHPRTTVYTFALAPWEAYPRSLSQVLGPVNQILQETFFRSAACEHVNGAAQKLKQKAALTESRRGLEEEKKKKESPDDPRLQFDLVESLTRSFRASGHEDGPKLQQLILRGHYREATEAADVLSTAFRGKRSRNGAELSPKVDAWAQRLRSLMVQMQQAHQKGDTARLANLEREYAGVVQSELTSVVTYVEWIASGTALTKLALLTAIVKHDQASASARDKNRPEVWNTPIQLWRSYLQNHSGSADSAYAQRMLADALAASGQKKTAAEAYKKAAESATHPIEKAACSYLSGMLMK